jgi:hypothetical protein
MRRRPGDGPGPSGRRDRDHRPAFGGFRQTDQLLHQRLTWRGAGEHQGDGADPESAGQDPLRRQGQRPAAVRVESAGHPGRQPRFAGFRRLRPVTDCSTRAPSTSGSPARSAHSSPPWRRSTRATTATTCR